MCTHILINYYYNQWIIDKRLLSNEVDEIRQSCKEDTLEILGYSVLNQYLLKYLSVFINDSLHCSSMRIQNVT
jgi:hypothetical protein